MTNIMIIDDDPYIRELERTLLRNEDYTIYEASNGRDALQQLKENKIDLCVLDIMMPEMDGYEFCRLARKYYQDLPILMLTAKGDLSQKVKGFESGADDYLTKPFEGIELIVRVKALLRRYKIVYVVEIGTLILDKSSHAITCNGEQSDIPMKEFELLYKLGSMAGKTLTRDQLIEDIWGYDFEGNERTLDVHINRLRERFPSEKYKFKISTIRGLGYRLEVLHEPT